MHVWCVRRQPSARSHGQAAHGLSSCAICTHDHSDAPAQAEQHTASANEGRAAAVAELEQSSSAFEAQIAELRAAVDAAASSAAADSSASAAALERQQQWQSEKAALQASIHVSNRTVPFEGHMVCVHVLPVVSMGGAPTQPRISAAGGRAGSSAGGRLHSIGSAAGLGPRERRPAKGAENDI